MILYQVPRDPLPAVQWDERVSLGALKRSDQEGNSGEVRRSTEEKKKMGSVSMSISQDELR